MARETGPGWPGAGAAAGGWAADGGGPGAGPRTRRLPCAPCRPPAALRAPPPRPPGLRTCRRSPAPPGRGAGVRASLCLGRRGVPGSLPPEGTTGDIPRPEISAFGIPEGWGGDVLNFYWLLMLCIFQTSWGGGGAGERAWKAPTTEVIHFS